MKSLSFCLKLALVLAFSYSVLCAPFWLELVKHNGMSAFNPNTQYTVWRNVKDYGAVGDGVHDDTAAINAAVMAGDRCGEGCGSSTITPGIVYFPSGTYLISSPIIQYYYTQFVGDAINIPTLLASSSMSGYLIQSDPYDDHGNSWWVNQDNFYRQVRNFRIDLTRCPPTVNCVGIHWQVAQATSITNVVIEMSKAAGNQHQGIWMENGSGGFMSDLILSGGKNGLWVGNQQFTSRNLTISSAQTAIYMNWNWGWTFKTLSISSCSIGVDISSGTPSSQSAGSILLLDASFSSTTTAILTNTAPSSQPRSAGTMTLDNVKFSNVQTAIARPSGAVVLPGSPGSFTLTSWGQGELYNGSVTNTFVQGGLYPAPRKASMLLNAQTGYFFERPRPQYGEYGIESVVNVKLEGVMGDGKTDDTNAIQKVMNKYGGQNMILFFPAGSYVVTNTVNVPAGSKIVGEVWSVIMSSGQSNFGDMNNPKPVWRIGQPGQTGGVELSDLLFSTQGPTPGAILVEWNLRDPSGQQGANGMWDVHFRIGGAIGTNMQVAQCSAGSNPSAQCMGAFALLHLTPQSSCYLENVWGWTADHDLDSNNGGQTSIYTGRGFLIESQGPVWMYGTAAEHNVMYQYSVINAMNVMMGMIQIETPYYQSSPPAPAPYVYRADYSDPDFSGCPSQSATCAMAWGLRLVNSSQVYVYGAGLYVFFNNYDQSCLKTENCQDSMVDVRTSGGNGRSGVYVYNLSTKAATNMVVANGVPYIEQADNVSTFCSTIVADLTHA